MFLENNTIKNIKSKFFYSIFKELITVAFAQLEHNPPFEKTGGPEKT